MRHCSRLLNITDNDGDHYDTMIIAQACGSGTRPLVLATAECMAHSIGAMMMAMEQQIVITPDKKVSCITATITTTIMYTVGKLQPL